MLLAVVGEFVGREVLAIHGEAVVDGAAGEVVVEPVHVAADVGDAVVQAEGFDHVEAAVGVDIEGDGVGEVGLGRDE